MWLHIPAIGFPSAPALEDSTLPCDWQIQAIAPSATLNGKHTVFRFWRNACKKNGWTRLLCGAILPPSTASHGVGLWMASLRDSRANQSPGLEPLKASTTTDGFGITLKGSFARYSLDGCFLKMSQQSSLPGIPQLFKRYSGRWPVSGSMRNGTCFLRKKLGRRTSARGGSAWATPTQRDYRDGGMPSLKAPTRGLLGRQAPRMAMPGEQSSQATLTSRRRLNPAFAAWLMGFPWWWTNPEQTSCEDLAMQWFRCRQRMLAELCGDV